MQELLEQLFEYLRGIWRFRWIGLLVVWLAALGGWLYIAQMPEQYLATARIHIDTNSLLRQQLRGLTIAHNVERRVALMTRTLLSRPNLEKLMRMVDLDLQVTNDKQKEELLNGLGDSISLTGQRRDSSLYSISAKHQDRATSKNIVQSLISIFIEDTLGGKRIESAGAQEFLDKQILEYEKRLEVAENRLADFKRRHVGNMPGETGGFYTRLEMAKSQLSAARLELKESENRRLELMRQVEGEEPVFLPDDTDIDITSTSSPLDDRINALRMRRDELLLRYTKRHPEVIQINSLIASLEAKRKRAIKKIAPAGSPSMDLNTNIVYQQMRSMLAETEARVAELKVRVGEYDQRAQTLEKMIDNIPMIEAELKQLNRDYAVISEQHSALLERRESARLSGSAERNESDVRFKVIDPPFVPLKPNEPNKLLLNGIVLFVSIGVGIGLALLVSLFRPVFSTSRLLAQVTGLPVLGSVLLNRTPAQKRKATASRLLFFTLAFSLIIVFAGVNMGQNFGVDLLRNF